MNVELRHLRVVVLVAEAGSVGRAARWLKVSQPSLTAQLKRIEAAFGGELFEQIAQAEQRFADQLREALPPNARVIVKASINTISSDETKETYDPKGIIQKETVWVMLR